MANPMRYWSKDEDLQIKALRAKGSTMRDIALTLNRPYHSTRSRIHQLLTDQAVPFLTPDECETRVVISRQRRSTKLQAKARTLISRMPNTKNMGYVIGVLYGDGFTNFKDIANGIPKSIGLSTTNASFRDAFIEALESWSGINTVKKAEHLVKEVRAPQGAIYRNVLYYDAWLHNRYLITELLKHTGPTQTVLWSINTQEAISRGPDFCNGILQGLFDSDGSFSMSSNSMTISFGTASPNGANSLCKLLGLLSYDFHRYTTTEPNHRPFYRITLRTTNSKLKFTKQVGSRIDYKAALIAEFIRQKSGPQFL